MIWGGDKKKVYCTHKQPLFIQHKNDDSSLQYHAHIKEFDNHPQMIEKCEEWLQAVDCCISTDVKVVWGFQIQTSKRKTWDKKVKQRSEMCLIHLNHTLTIWWEVKGLNITYNIHMEWTIQKAFRFPEPVAVLHLALLSQRLFTGSKVDTPATAPPIATSTTPPATTLKSKFFREAETPGWAASAISGTTAAASRAKPVSPAMFCSFCEALHIQLNPVIERSGNPQGIHNIPQIACLKPRAK
jgi:hypothetical protein